MPIYVDPKGGDVNLRRAQAIYSQLPIDKKASSGQFVAIEVLAQDFNVAVDELSAKRGLMAKGYPGDNIAVIKIQ